MTLIKIIIFALTLAIAAPVGAQFRATTIATESALTRLRSQAASTRAFLQRQRALMVAPTVDATVTLAVIQHLAQMIPVLTALAGTPGLAEYARAQLNDPGYDIVAEFTAMRAQLINLRNSLMGAFPTSGGFLAYEQLDGTGVKVTRTFTAAQMAAGVVLMDAAIATIQ